MPAPDDEVCAALVGRTIAGKFAIEQLVGIGGMGAVYRARQIALHRMVALKVMRPEVAPNRQHVERFKREAQAASRLEHPNSVRVLDFGEDETGLLYLAMELVEGRNLLHLIKQEWPIDERRTVHLMSQVLAALGVAHELGVIHRDLKPDNILVVPITNDDGEAAELAKICDFGIAKVATPSGATSAELLMGTPDYMSPEQIRGEPLDHRTDIYSAGVVLYYLLAGRLPFSAETAVGVALRHVTDVAPPPSQFVPVNAQLEAVCAKAMSKAREDRFGSARAMRAALRSAIGLGDPAGDGQTPRPMMVPSVNHPTDLGVTTVVVQRSRFSRSGRAFLGLTALLLVALPVMYFVRGRSPAPGPIAQPAPAVAAAQVAAAASMPAPPAAIPAAIDPPAGGPSKAVVAPHAIAPDEASPRRHRAAGKAASGTRARRRLQRLGKKNVAARADSSLRPASALASSTTTTAAPLFQAKPEVAAPPAPPPPARPAVAGAPPLAIDRCRVVIGETTTSSAISAGNVRAALNPASLQRCYLQAMQAHGAAGTGTATAELRIDINGMVKTARVIGADFLPGMKDCLERSLRLARIRDVDTGEASARVTLEFRAGR